MNAFSRAGNSIGESIALLAHSAGSEVSGREGPAFLHLCVHVEVEDALAFLRTAMILAKHFRAALVLDLPDAGLGRNGCAPQAAEIRLGTTSCSAMLSGFFDSVERKLRQPCGGSPRTFSIEVGFLAEAQAFLVRIRTLEQRPPSASPDPRNTEQSVHGSAATQTK